MDAIVGFSKDSIIASIADFVISTHDSIRALCLYLQFSVVIN